MEKRSFCTAGKALEVDKALTEDEEAATELTFFIDLDEDGISEPRWAGGSAAFAFGPKKFLSTDMAKFSCRGMTGTSFPL